MGQIILPKILHPDFSSPLKQPRGDVVLDYPLGQLKVVAIFDQLMWRDLTGNKPGTADPSGSVPGVVVNRHGKGISYNTNQNQTLTPAGYGTQNHTFIIVRSPDDATNRNNSTWGTSTGLADQRFQAHMPWGNGDVFFDYGGSSGNNRLTWPSSGGYTKVADEREVWFFTAGEHGSEIWFNGDLKASQAVAISRASDAEDFNINVGVVSNGDDQTVYFVALLNRVMPHAEIIKASREIYRSFLKPANQPRYFPAAAAASAVLTGTMLATVDEDDITTGGKTIIITLTGDTFKAAGTGPIGSTADTQALIDGVTATTSPANGWNAEVRDKALTSEIVRTDDNTATWTVAAQAGFDISAQQTIESIIPTAVLVTAAAAITATPTFTIDEAVSGIQPTNYYSLLLAG